MPGFLAGPKPARGLETAALGTNSPPVLVGGADRRDRKGPVVISSDICRGLSLNNTGSARSSSFPASYTMVSKWGGGEEGNKRLTAAFSSSTTASFISWKTSTRRTRACFSRVCCKRPSCVAGGRLRIRTDRLRVSAWCVRPVSPTIFLQRKIVRLNYCVVTIMNKNKPVASTHAAVGKCHSYTPLLEFVVIRAHGCLRIHLSRLISQTP
jgi:hypothetical protein